MSKLTFTSRKTLLASAIVIGLVGVASTTTAQQFTATATVQNAVTLTQVTPLSFGTVFATTTGASATAAADNSWKLTLSAIDGNITTTNATTPVGALTPKILSLGGATLGSYSAPGLPANGTVVLDFKTAADGPFTPSTLALASCNYNLASEAITAGKIVLQNGADPSTGFFCVDVFTTNRTGLTTAGTGYNLGFGVTQLTFDLGATLLNQRPTTAASRTYQEGTYSGSFGMEVGFP